MDIQSLRRSPAPGPGTQASLSAPAGAEADHRIANSLAMISALVRLKAPQLAARPERVADFLLEIAGRIDAVAGLHRILSTCGTTGVLLSDYVPRVCESLSSTLAGGQATSFRYNFAPFVKVPPDVAQRIGLLAAELVTNAVKYAHPAGVPLRVTVSCTYNSGGDLVLEFEDDGVGFPENFDPDVDGDLGLRLVGSLCQQLHARHAWTSHELGLRFCLIVPADVLREPAE
jgi:two-component sensor histidine kinase